MKRILLLAVAFVFLNLLSCSRGLTAGSGVANFGAPSPSASQASPPSGGATSNPAPNPPAAPSQPTGLVLYVSNSINSFDSTATMAALHIDSQTGVVTQLPGSPFTVPSNITQLMPTPDGRFLFIAKYEDDEEGPGGSAPSRNEAGLYRTVIGPSGALTQEFTKVDNATIALMHSSGKILIFRGTEIDTYNVDPSTGDLNLASQTETSTPVQPLFIEQNDLWSMYSQNSSQPSKQVFTLMAIDAETGKLTSDANQIVVPAGPSNGESEIWAIPAPFGLFVGNNAGAPAQNSMTLYEEEANGFAAVQNCTQQEFAPCGGAPIELSSPPGIVSPDGKFLFAFTDAPNQPARIWSIPLNANTGMEMAAAHSIIGDTGSYSNVVLSNDGKLLYLVGAGPIGPQGGTTLISSFRVASDGTLTATLGSPYIFNFAPRIWFATTIASVQE